MRLYLLTFFMALSIALSYSSGWAQANNRHLLLKLTHQDPENAYNSTFQRVNMYLASNQQVSSICYVQPENAFIVKADTDVNLASIKQKLGDQVVIQDIKSIQYQNLLRQQAAFRLAKKNTPMLNDSSYPKYISTGNTSMDKERYQKAIEKWLDKNPDKFNHIIQNRN